MFLQEPLQKLGLTEKEAKIYLASLEIGGGSVQEISTKAEIKRPTTYVILEQLIKKGLMYEEKKSRGSLYNSASPEILKRHSEEQQKILAEALPFLRAMNKGKKAKPQVQVYEGIEGMKQVYLENIWKSKTEILFFSSIQKIYEIIPDLLDKWIKDMAHEQKQFQHNIRELINPDPKDIEYGLKTEKIHKKQSVRVIPKDFPFKFIGTDNAIFEDKIMMVSFEDKLFTTIIQSKHLADTLRTIYELAWQQAIPINKFIKKYPEYANKN
jgi:HTH-type transcriptional regulator, sugar sensing transcriptional regulator